jgi:hypothetical protein
VATNEHHGHRANARRHLSEVPDTDTRKSTVGRVDAGRPQVFASLTVSCHGCGRSVAPGEWFMRHAIPDDRRDDLTAPFCQTCRPLVETEPNTGEDATPQDLVSALRRGLERQARAENVVESSGTSG